MTYSIETSALPDSRSFGQVYLVGEDQISHDDVEIHDASVSKGIAIEG